MATNPAVEHRHPDSPTAYQLHDAEGTIPTFPPRALDAQGRLLPISAQERATRSRAVIRALDTIACLADNDPPGTDERMMRGIDANRPDGAKLFEGCIDP